MAEAQVPEDFFDVLTIGVAAALFVINRTTSVVGDDVILTATLSPAVAFDAADHFVKEARKRYG